ncbi:hypothetical protein IT575_04260 [bacterium]|nr:hypothetical protein [bacterium]
MRGALRLALLCACVTLAAMLSYSAAFAGDVVQEWSEKSAGNCTSCAGKCGDPCPKCKKCCKEEDPCICCVDQCGNPLPMTEGSCVTPPVARQGAWEIDPCCCPPEQYTLCCTKAKYSSCFPREEFKLLCCAKKCCEDKCGCQEKKCGCEKKCCKKDKCGCKKKCCKKDSCGCNKCEDSCGKCGGDKAEKKVHEKPLPDVLWTPRPMGDLPRIEAGDELEFGEFVEGPAEVSEEKPIKVEGRG